MGPQLENALRTITAPFEVSWQIIKFDESDHVKWLCCQAFRGKEPRGRRNGALVA